MSCRNLPVTCKMLRSEARKIRVSVAAGPIADQVLALPCLALLPLPLQLQNNNHVQDDLEHVSMMRTTLRHLQNACLHQTFVFKAQPPPKLRHICPVTAQVFRQCSSFTTRRDLSQDKHLHLQPKRPEIGNDTSSRVLSRHLHSSKHLRAWHPTAGAEPGLDPNSHDTTWDPPQADRNGQIKIIDYSSSQLEENDVNSNDLESYLRDQPKPDWAATRWIWVNGINYDVVKCLGLSKGLHPLAIEDVMDTHTTTKVDWYDDHCFLEMNLVKLAEEDQDALPKASQSQRTLVPGRFGKHSTLPRRLPTSLLLPCTCSTGLNIKAFCPYHSACIETWAQKTDLLSFNTRVPDVPTRQALDSCVGGC